MAKWRDIEGIVGAAEGLVSDINLQHIRRILTSGCPAEFNWEESAENKKPFIRRGKNPLVERNIEIVTTTLNKEERKNHVVPFSRWVARASLVARCAPQTIIPGKVNELEPEKKQGRLSMLG